MLIGGKGSLFRLVYFFVSLSFYKYSKCVKVFVYIYWIKFLGKENLIDLRNYFKVKWVILNFVSMYMELIFMCKNFIIILIKLVYVFVMYLYIS